MTRTILAVGPADGGVGHVFGRVVRGLRDQGHGVTTIALPGYRKVPAASGIAKLVSARHALRQASTVHIEFGSNDLETFWFALIAVLMRRDCVVVAHDHPKLILAPAAGLVPVSSRLLSVLAYRVLSPILDALLVRVLLRRAGVVVVFGEAACRGWRNSGARNVMVIAHGGEPATSGAPPPSQGQSVLLAGFLGPSKGIDTLLEAWAMIGDRTPLPLIFAGQPHEPWFSETIARFQGVANLPRVLGPIADDREFQTLIGSAAMVVLPYRYSSPASGVLVRALSAGRPVVATPVPAVRGTIRDGENGVLVPIGDAEALAEAVMTLCDSPAYRDKLGAAAAETAARLFSWRAHLDGLELAYRAAEQISR
jgi:glycosyltransferase involved in cell wall biosynthesis